MLFCNQFKNYEDFRSRFGFKTGVDGRYLSNANGVRQRKNNIVYLYWKEHVMYLHNTNGHNLEFAYDCAPKFNKKEEVLKDMLYNVFFTYPSDLCPIASFGDYEILNHGICMDGDISAVRYKDKRTGNVYKMKIGKYVNKYIENMSDPPFWINNSTLRIFFIEEMTELWKNKRLKEKTLNVVVNKDFNAIYDPSRRPSDEQQFDSCMDGDENWNYYKEHSNIYDAISLQDEDGWIYARAILVKCKDKEGNDHRYLERIYCNKRMYKDLLFEKAKALGLFDLYKSLEASCHESKEIYSVETDKRIRYRVYIEIDLEDGDWLSYQDTFKYYYPDLGRAYNYEIDTSCRYVMIDRTDENYYDNEEDE